MKDNCKNIILILIIADFKMLSIKNKKCINPFKKLIYHTLVRLKNAAAAFFYKNLKVSIEECYPR